MFLSLTQLMIIPFSRLSPQEKNASGFRPNFEPPGLRLPALGVTPVEPEDFRIPVI